MTDHETHNEETADGGLDPEPTIPGADGPMEIPEDPAEAVPVLMDALISARAEAAEMKEHWQRVSAEFDNFRKRALRDQEALVGRATERLLADLLPTLDSFDAAVAFDAETDREEKLLTGMTGTRTQLLTTLAAAGLESIETVGAAFDPELHEAVQMGDGTGTMVVTEEYRRGYRLHGRVLRAAMVAVGYEEEQSEG